MGMDEERRQRVEKEVLPVSFSGSSIEEISVGEGEHGEREA